MRLYYFTGAAATVLTRSANHLDTIATVWQCLDISSNLYNLLVPIGFRDDGSVLLWPGMVDRAWMNFTQIGSKRASVDKFGSGTRFSQILLRSVSAKFF